MRTTLVLIFSLFSLISPAHAGDFLFPAFGCHASEQECFNTLEKTIAVKYSGFPADDVPTLYSYKKKTDYVFVVTPGLWSNSSQFKDAIDLFFNQYKQNVLALVLPGHGADVANINKVQYGEWLQSYMNAIQSAQYLGKKLVLVGQSTGGLLAVYSALAESSNVAGLILFEPALELRDVIELSVCHGSDLREKLSKIESIGDIMKQFPENMESGCQVVKLEKELRETFSTTVIPHKPTVWKKLAKKIHLPVFFYNHPKDNVVSASMNKTFVKSLSGPLYYNELNVKPHLKKLPKPKSVGDIAKRAVLDVFLGDARLTRLHGSPLSIGEALQSSSFKSFVKKELKLKP